jgi:cytidylate kinase
MSKIIITVDGWSSCGKSTMARQLAKRLNYIFIDSGAMYRAITLQFLRGDVSLDEPEQINNALSAIELDFRLNPSTGNNEIWMNGENVEPYIREMTVAQKVSEVAAIKAVREFAVQQQQRIGANKGIVMDGRDIGTVVFPNAELKIFMTADVDIRIDRRYQELRQKSPGITREEVKSNLMDRDYQDSHRAISPLRQPEDARVLDNSRLTPDEQFELALNWALEKISAK